MGLFSPAPPLDDQFRAAVSPFWFTGDIGSRDQKAGLEKLVSSQEAIRTALRPNETLVVIVPCFAQNTGYAGLCVVTSERILHVKGKRIEKEIPRGDLADVAEMVTPSGHFILQLISRKAAPFAAFKRGDVRNKSTMNFWEGTIQVPISTSDLMEDLVGKTRQ